MSPLMKFGAAAFGFSALSAAWSISDPSSAYAQSETVSPPPAAQSEPVSESATAESEPAGTSGMVIHIDPQTGKIIPEPVPGSPRLTLSPAELNAASTSSEGLLETAAPGGGVMVDLQGRFQNPLIATIGPDGKLIMQHLNDFPQITK